MKRRLPSASCASPVKSRSIITGDFRYVELSNILVEVQLIESPEHFGSWMFPWLHASRHCSGAGQRCPCRREPVRDGASSAQADGRSWYLAGLRCPGAMPWLDACGSQPRSVQLMESI